MASPCRPGPPRWSTTTRCSRRPSSGSRVAKGMSIDDIATYLNETALFRNQWGFRPEAGEDDPAFKDRVRSRLREELATAKAEQLLVPQVAWGHFAANADGDDLVIWTDESRIHRTDAVRLPPPDRGPVPVHRRLLPDRRLRRQGLRQLPGRDHGRARVRGGRPPVRRRRVPAVPVPARARRRDGRGAGRVLAPPHPRGAGLRRSRTARPSPGSSARSTAAVATRGATRPAPASRTTPRWSSSSRPSASASR